MLQKSGGHAKAERNGNLKKSCQHNIRKQAFNLKKIDQRCRKEETGTVEQCHPRPIGQRNIPAV